MYEIRFSQDVLEDLAGIRPHDRNPILNAVEEQLAHTPDTETRNRKVLMNLIPPFEAVPPVWELRVGDYRVFYDVSSEEKTVTIRAVRRKPPHRSTEEIL